MKKTKDRQEGLGESLGLLVDVLQERLKDRTITAAEMNVLRQLLKDNNVTIDRQSGQGIAQELREVLDGIEIEFD